MATRLHTPRVAASSPFDADYLEELVCVCKKHKIAWTGEQYGLQSVWVKVLNSFQDISFERYDWREGLCILKQQGV